MLRRRGWAIAAASVLLLVVGVVVDYPELVVLAFVGLAALVAAGLWATARPRLLVVREVRPARVVEGEGARAYLTVTNRARRRSPALLAVERVAGREVGVALPPLPAGATCEASYPLNAERRGVFSVGPLTVGHSDPLRLLAVGETHSTASLLRVLPRVHPVAPLPTGPSLERDGPTTAAPQGGVAFHSLREYVLGDDLRLVHWKSTARAGRLMVRHHVRPNEPHMMVVLDTSAAAYAGVAPGAFEDAVRVAASLAVAAVEGGFPFELHTTGGRGAVAERGEPVAPVLDLLAEVALEPQAEGLSRLLNLVPRQEGVALGVVTGPGRDGLRPVTQVRNRFSMVCLIQLGEAYGRAAPDVPGAVAVAVRTSADFVGVWQRLVVR